MSDLVEQLRKAALILPIRRNDTADYAEVFGQDFQAMTVTPERFEALSVLPEAADRLEQLENESILCLLKLAAMEEIIKERDQLKEALRQGEQK